MVGYFGQLARTQQWSDFEVRIPQGYHVPHCVGNPHWRIPNSSVRTNSSETRRSSSLSLKKLTELIWDFQWLHLKGLGRCRILDEHHMEITFLSITSTSFNSTVFPMTQEREKWNYENKSLHASDSSHEYPSFQGHTNFITFKVFRRTKVFSRRHSFLGVDFLCKYQTPHRLIDMCTLTNASVP